MVRLKDNEATEKGLFKAEDSTSGAERINCKPRNQVDCPQSS